MKNSGVVTQADNSIWKHSITWQSWEMQLDHTLRHVHTNVHKFKIFISLEYLHMKVPNLRFTNIPWSLFTIPTLVVTCAPTETYNLVCKKKIKKLVSIMVLTWVPFCVEISSNYIQIILISKNHLTHTKSR